MPENGIGKVTATQSCPTSCSTVYFWVARDVVLRPFDIVRIPHVGQSHSYAIVRDLQYLTDSAGHLTNYVSSDFGDVTASPHNERLGTTIAEAEVLYNTGGVEMPLRDGAVVEWADEEGIRTALGMDNIKSPIPAGHMSLSNGTNIQFTLEAKYLLGPEGAHFNIAGISGLATKTSYAMFLLAAIQQKLQDPVKTVIFNVKGEDLLAIDEPCTPPLSGDQEQQWLRCGLTPRPFDQVTYLYPFFSREEWGYANSFVDKTRLAQQQGDGRACNFFYDVDTALPRLSLLFADIEDPSANIDSILQALRGRGYDTWDDLRSAVQANTRSGQSPQISVQSWRRFFRLLTGRTKEDCFTERARHLPEKKRHVLIREQLKKLRPGGLMVVDIAALPNYLQAFVVGDVIQTIYEAKLGDADDFSYEDAAGKVVILADELNKYAPKTSSVVSSLASSLLEVSERGRSMGVVLFGAEQFRSGVHERILGNCSTNAFGRTSPIEVEKCPDYRYFPKTYKWAVQRLEKGQLLLQHAIFKTSLVKLQFPHPAYFQPKAD